MLPPLQILIFPAVLASLTLLGMGVLLWEWRAARRLRRERLALEEQLTGLRREMRGAVELGVRAGRRLCQVEQELKQLNDRMGLIESRGEGRDYDQAINLVRRGADANNLISQFGMSRGEAELVALMHGRERKAG